MALCTHCQFCNAVATMTETILASFFLARKLSYFYLTLSVLFFVFMANVWLRQRFFVIRHFFFSCSFSSCRTLHNFAMEIQNTINFIKCSLLLRSPLASHFMHCRHFSWKHKCQFHLYNEHCLPLLNICKWTATNRTKKKTISSNLFRLAVFGRNNFSSPNWR